MKTLKKNYSLLIIIILFAIISILTIYSSQTLLPSYMSNLYLKQILWYILGFIIIFIVLKIDNSFIYNKIFIFYIVMNLFLLLVLFFGSKVNDAKCWFNIPFIGTFQPSEFMKIVLIITLANMIDKFNLKYKNPSIKDELTFLIKVSVIVFIPSFLTFLEPDTGVVIIYLIIAVGMLFISGIRYRWFNIILFIFLLSIGIILYTYFFNKNLFINIFGSSFFLRIERLLNWSNKSGYQLENSLITIGSSGLFGNGYMNNQIHLPEAQTDFIFSIYSGNFGFIGSFIIITLFTILIINLINIAYNTTNYNKYIIGGIISMLLYQVFQNIGMTIGILPITGITLPFISYGGSSLISYMIMIGIIINMQKEKKLKSFNHF